MTQPFRRTRDHRIKNRLTSEERVFLSSLLDDMSDLAMREQTNLWRLFPPRYSDPARQAAYELEHSSDMDTKLEVATAFTLCRSLLAEVNTFSQQQADELLRGLNRIRLLLASLLGIESDDLDLPENATDEVRMTYNVYHYLAWLVSSLVDEMLPSEPDPKAD